jgi:hypothetical protein
MSRRHFNTYGFEDRGHSDPADCDDPVTIADVTILHETDGGALVYRVGSSPFAETATIPKSVVHDDSEVWQSGDGPGDLVIARWFAEQEGLDA